MAQRVDVVLSSEEREVLERWAMSRRPVTCPCAAGMRRHAPREGIGVWIALLRGALGLPWASRCDRCRWIVLAAVTAGRIAGSVRHRVLFL